MLYRYKFANGDVSEVEVAEELYFEITMLDTEMRRNDARNTGINRECRDKDTGRRQKTGRHLSLDAFLYEGIDYSIGGDMLTDIIKKEETAELRTVVTSFLRDELQEWERELVYKKYIRKQTSRAIAKEQGQSEAWISRCLKIIQKKLIIYLQSNRLSFDF